MTYLQFKQSLDALGIKDDQPVTFAVHREINPLQWFATTDDYNIDASRMSDRIWRVSLIPESATKPHAAPQSTQQDSAIPAQLGAATANPDATAAMVWQPINTAPKDGSEVLLYWTEWSDLPTIGQWQQGGWRARHCLYYDPQFGPTHWMPLPPAPTI